MVARQNLITWAQNLPKNSKILRSSAVFHQYFIECGAFPRHRSYFRRTSLGAAQILAHTRLNNDYLCIFYVVFTVKIRINSSHTAKNEAIKILSTLFF